MCYKLSPSERATYCNKTEELNEEKVDEVVGCEDGEEEIIRTWKVPIKEIKTHYSVDRLCKIVKKLSDE